MPNQQVSEMAQILYVPIKGLAKVSIEQKKTLLVTDPLNYEDYDENIDLTFPDKASPIICVPIMDKEKLNVEGCMQLEYKNKNLIIQNPLSNMDSSDYKLDHLTKEVLEIFSN